MQLLDSEILGHTIISSKSIQTYKPIIPTQKLWVARITGIDAKFGFKREFVNQESDEFIPEYKIVFFYLKAGFIYQYANVFVEKGEYASGFFAVTADGEKIFTLSVREVRRYLNMPVTEWKTKELIAYADDDVPF
jgi:hypothetical protein